jgi:hypothetical protein
MPDRTVFLHRNSRRFALLALVAVFCFSARADIIFSNLDTSNIGGYTPICSKSATGSNTGCPFGTIGGGELSAAAAFTPSADVTVTAVKVLVAGSSPFNPNINFFSLGLGLDNNGVPGSGLGGASAGPISQAPSLVTLILAPIALTAGTEYWLTMTPTPIYYTYWVGGGSAAVPGALISWNGFTGQNGNSPDLHQPPEWFASGPTTLQFEIDGVPTPLATPEPSDLALLGLAILLVLQRALHNPGPTATVSSLHNR